MESDKLDVTPDQALKLIAARYRDYVVAQARWEASVEPMAGHAVGSRGSGSFPAWAESQAQLNRLFGLLDGLFMAPAGAVAASPEASKETKGDL